ncbi:MAG: right-handed parallel beta-helix repeat-containing protein [Bacteroidota bacterium]
MKKACLLPLLLLLNCPLFATVWQVGPTRTYTKPSQVAALVGDGDVVEIDAGVYVADVCTWSAPNLTLRGVGGTYARLNAQGTSAQGKAIWVISGNNATVENIEFYNCTVSDQNGAGIRQEGVGLTVRNCYFHDNDEGILAGDKVDSEILIEYSNFEHNGFGDGQSHNIYINHIKKLVLRYNWFHRAKIGHEIKSRAYETLIYCNRISNEDGDASREIDVPNGGKLYVIGNVIQQGTNGQNSNIIGFGMEGLTNPGPQSVFLINNTIWNQKTVGSFIQFPNTVPSLKAWNNLLLGGGNFMTGANIPASLDTMANLRYTNIVDAKLTDPQQFNFEPLCASACIDAGVNPGMDGIMNLLPAHSYQHPTGSKTRTTLGYKPDIGAFEGQCGSFTQAPVRPEYLQRGNQRMYLLPDAPDCTLEVYDLQGRLLEQGGRAFDWATRSQGIYVVLVREKGRFVWTERVGF